MRWQGRGVGVDFFDRDSIAPPVEPARNPVRSGVDTGVQVCARRIRKVPIFHLDARLIRHDIQGAPALHPANMDGGVGNGISRIAGLCGQRLLQRHHFGHKAAGEVQRIRELRRKRAVAGLAMARDLQRRLALVADGNLHGGRFPPHDDHARAANQRRKRRHHLADTDAANLFIIGDHQAQGCLGGGLTPSPSRQASAEARYPFISVVPPRP